jgi:hypothetical protein
MLNYNLFALTAEQIYECKLIINGQESCAITTCTFAAKVFTLFLLICSLASACQAGEKKASEE